MNLPTAVPNCVRSIPEIRGARFVVSAGLVTGFACLTALGAALRVPLPGTPVPFTLQTLFVLTAGATLGAGRGFLSQALYLALGSAGLPFFAAGPFALTGPTGGYLAGFAAAAVVVGGLTGGRRRSVPGTLGAMALGLAVVYASGVLQLMAWTSAGVGEALSLGVLPFLPGEAIKLAAAAAAAVSIRRIAAR